MKPFKVWDDTGTGGTPGSLWVVNTHGLMVATTSHLAPEGPHYEVMQ